MGLHWFLAAVLLFDRPSFSDVIISVDVQDTKQPVTNEVRIFLTIMMKHSKSS
ncbi:hypothetical protein M758_UG180000 [Ceratodon purpureus]|nr:hypothetical protein M758_UG180000 [Ceratodon purpureus]